MKNKKPSILYRLFDSNVYGKFSQYALFFGALALVAGQFLAANILIGFGGLALGGSIYKNILDTRKMKQYKQENEIEYEEYIPEIETKLEHTISKPQTHENYRHSNKNNSNDRSL